MKIIVFLLASLLVIPFSLYSFAQNSYDVNIPTGAANPNAPFFWQSEKDGGTSGVVEINVGDTVIWKNADTAPHTVTSGSAAEGPDDLFDSNLFAPGKSYTRTFDEVGQYPYFCLIHPWMEGTVIVTAGYSIIPNVGKQVGDGSTLFDVEYDFNRLLSLSSIDQDQKSITFEVTGAAKSDNHDLELILPSKLIDGPLVIWLDGEKMVDFEIIRDGDNNVLFLTLEDDSKLLTIVGTSVVPEFGILVLPILGVSIFMMVLLSQRLNSFLK